MAGQPYDIRDRTFQFARDIVRLGLSLPAHAGISALLSKPLVRAGTSVAADVAEAQTASSRLTFVAKHAIARERIREVIFWLRLIETTQIGDSVRITALLEEARQLQTLLITILRNSQE